VLNSDLDEYSLGSVPYSLDELFKLTRNKQAMASSVWPNCHRCLRRTRV